MDNPHSNAMPASLIECILVSLFFIKLETTRSRPQVAIDDCAHHYAPRLRTVSPETGIRTCAMMVCR
jgi:hypothetical protein